MQLPYFPFEIMTESYKPAMGLKPLDLSKWIELDETFETQVSKKKNILQNQQDLVLKFEPIASGAILETQELLKDHLLTHFPQKYSLKGSEFKVDNQHTYHLSSEPQEALRNISQWVQEDFAFMSPESPSRLVGGCICFPSRWNLPQKMNLGSDAIHAPVPKFKESIAKATGQFLERIQVEKPMWRLNWTIHDCPEIFTPFPEEGRSDLNASNIIEHTYLRMERQTLRRLPKTQFVLFTIRTYIFPMKYVISDAQKKIALKSTLDHLPIETAHYKGMRKFFDLLKNSL